MSGSIDYFESTTTLRHADSIEWDTTTAHVEVTTSVPSLEDVFRDVHTEDTAITVASLINAKSNDFNFTQLLVDGTDRYPSVLTPISSLWTLFPLVFMIAFLGAWLFRLKCWYYYSRAMVALGLESEFKSGSHDRVPTELSSARLLRAVKSQLNLAEMDEFDGAPDGATMNVTADGRRTEDHFVTVRL